jgi:hypothetical protein
VYKAEPQFGPHYLKDVERRLIGFVRRLMLNCFVEEIRGSHCEKQMDVCQKGFQPTLKKEAREEYVFRHSLAALFVTTDFSQPRKAEGAGSACSWNERARFHCKLADTLCDMFAGVCVIAKNAFLAEE